MGVVLVIKIVDLEWDLPLLLLFSSSSLSCYGVMGPAQLGKWLVLFCDEINLPDLDKYYGEREGKGTGRGRRREDKRERARE